MATETVFVLKEPLGSERQKTTLWYRSWTAIGPCTTADPAERAEYPTRGAALAARCWQHSMTFWEIEEVPVGQEAIGGPTDPGDSSSAAPTQAGGPAPQSLPAEVPAQGKAA